MVVEYIRYTVPADRAEAFESAYAQAGNLLEQAEHCLSFEIARGIEEPEHFIVRIEWDSLEDHERGFRASPNFQEFFRDVQPFFSEIDEMKHYEIRGGGSNLNDRRSAA
jgi:heme-degrading monooxygenase HmoA